jgi:hypothetical protein
LHRPLGLQGLDESLGLAVGLGPLRPSPLGFQAKYGASLPPLLGMVGTSGIRVHPAAGDALAVEPGHSPHQKTHRRGLLLIRQHLDVGQASRVIHGHIGLFIAGTRRAALAAITGDAVTDPLKAGQLFGVDVDHVAGQGPLVPADWFSGLQVLQATKPDGLEPTANSRERRFR